MDEGWWEVRVGWLENERGTSEIDSRWLQEGVGRWEVTVGQWEVGDGRWKMTGGR